MLISMVEVEAMFLLESRRGVVAAFAAGELGECFVDFYTLAAFRESLPDVPPTSYRRQKIAGCRG